MKFFASFTMCRTDLKQAHTTSAQVRRHLIKLKRLEIGFKHQKTSDLRRFYHPIRPRRNMYRM
jgi:hypothetical protein